MSLRKAIYRLTAIGFTSTVLLSLSSISANAATFNLSYKFKDGTALSALFEGELAENGNMVAISELESATLTDSTGNLLDFAPEGLAFKGRTTLDGGFSSLAVGSRVHSEPDAVGFKVFNNAKVGGREFSFVNLVYQSSQGKVNLAEAFSYSAFAVEKRDIPENSSTGVLLTALAGLGIAAAKKHSNQQEA